MPDQNNRKPEFNSISDEGWKTPELKIHDKHQDIAADTAGNLSWKELTPEVDGFTAQVALSLIESGRAEDVARDFDKYSHLPDEIVFKMIDVLGTKSPSIATGNIPYDILARYEQKKASFKFQSTSDSQLSPEYSEYLTYAPDAWKTRFATFTAEQQKKLCEQIEFFPNMVSFVVTQKIDGVDKRVKLYIENTDVVVSPEQVQDRKDVVIDNNTAHMTIDAAKDIVPLELHILWSTIKSIADLMPYQDFKMKTDIQSLKAIGEILHITESWCFELWNVDPQKKDSRAWLMTMWTTKEEWQTTWNPIVLWVNDKTGHLTPMKPEFMAPIRKMAKPREILE